MFTRPEEQPILPPGADEVLRMLDAARDQVRMQIMFLLGRHGSLNVSDIAARFQLSRPAISHHLKVLKDAGIVQSEKSGQEVFYRLDRQRVVARLRMLADAIENCCAPVRGQ